MEEIVLGGYKMSELKGMQAAIKQDAEQFIAENIEKAQTITKVIIALYAGSDEDEFEQPPYDVVKGLAQEATELFRSVDLVADISGVTFCLPFYEEYGNYGRNEILTRIIDDIDCGGSDVLSDLYGIIASMESDSRDWNSSRC